MYLDDILLQMDSIGVGSIPIVLLTGFFTGAIMALQMGRELQQYGQTGQHRQFVSIILVRELGPVLTAVMVAGRNSSGIASELGSMKVTEQIDAMRALGTDPIQKLVTPRMIATAIMLPCLTVIDDFIGMVGGWVIGEDRLRSADASILDEQLAGTGLERRGAGSAKAVHLFLRGFAGGLLLRAEHHGRHPGRGPRHDAGRGGGGGHYLRAGSVSSAKSSYRGRQDSDVCMPRRADEDAVLLEFDHVTVAFRRRRDALDDISFNGSAKARRVLCWARPGAAKPSC